MMTSAGWSGSPMASARSGSCRWTPGRCRSVAARFTAPRSAPTAGCSPRARATTSRKKNLSVTDASGATLDAFDSRSGLRPLRFSPSGALYAVCEGTNDGYRDGKPGEVSIRKPGQPRVIKRLKLPKMPWAADISRDDARVAVVWDDGAGLYSLPKGAELLKVAIPEYGEAVAAHPNAPRLAVTSKLRGGGSKGIGDVALYEVGTIGAAARFSPPARATALAFSAGGELLYVGLIDGTLLVLDGETLASWAACVGTTRRSAWCRSPPGACSPALWTGRSCSGACEARRARGSGRWAQSA
jgi:hypothetical protein